LCGSAPQQDANEQQPADTVCHADAPADTEVAPTLEFIIAAWPKLPQQVREQILTLIGKAMLES